MPDVLWRAFHKNRALADALPNLAADAIKYTYLVAAVWLTFSEN
jgi:hypothetical protein